MMTEWTGQQQCQLLLQSVLLGVVLGILFDFFNIAGKLRRRRWKVVFLCDVIFFLLASVVTFYFSLAQMNGRMHPLLFVGSFAGLIGEHCFFGRYFSKIIYCSGRYVYRVLYRFFSLFMMPIRVLFRSWCRLFGFVRRKTLNNSSKMRKNSTFFRKKS